MRLPRLRTFRRAAVSAIAFAVGLAVADRWMSTPLIADDALPTTTAPAPDVVATSRPTIPDDVRNVLDRVTAAYASLPLDLRGTLTEDFDVAGVIRQTTLDVRATVRSPTAFRHELGDAVTIVGDGSRSYVYDADAKQYTARDISRAATQPIVDADALAILAMQDPAAAVAVCGDAVIALVPAGATSVRLLDPSTQGSRSFDRVEVSADAIRVVTWIDRSNGRIDRSVIDYGGQLEKAGATPVRRAMVTVMYAFSGPATAPSMADARFTFEPPKGASEAKVARSGPLRLGGPAPAFELADLDGKSTRLADQRGHVVVLDFWATWCGPCRRSLPHLAAAARDYADKNVRVFAIDREEDAATVRSFLTNASLGDGLSVLLDVDSAVSTAYQVEGIPATFVIDSHGRLVKSIIGFAPGGEQVLRGAIDAALSAGEMTDVSPATPDRGAAQNR